MQRFRRFVLIVLFGITHFYENFVVVVVVAQSSTSNPTKKNLRRHPTIQSAQTQRQTQSQESKQQQGQFVQRNERRHLLSIVREPNNQLGQPLGGREYVSNPNDPATVGTQQQQQQQQQHGSETIPSDFSLEDIIQGDVLSLQFSPGEELHYISVKSVLFHEPTVLRGVGLADLDDLATVNLEGSQTDQEQEEQQVDQEDEQGEVQVDPEQMGEEQVGEDEQVQPEQQHYSSSSSSSSDSSSSEEEEQVIEDVNQDSSTTEDKEFVDNHESIQNIGSFFDNRVVDVSDISTYSMYGEELDDNGTPITTVFITQRRTEYNSPGSAGGPSNNDDNDKVFAGIIRHRQKVYQMRQFANGTDFVTVKESSDFKIDMPFLIRAPTGLIGARNVVIEGAPATPIDENTENFNGEINESPINEDHNVFILSEEFDIGDSNTESDTESDATITGETDGDSGSDTDGDTDGDTNIESGSDGVGDADADSRMETTSQSHNTPANGQGGSEQEEEQQSSCNDTNNDDNGDDTTEFLDVAVVYTQQAMCQAAGFETMLECRIGYTSNVKETIESIIDLSILETNLALQNSLIPTSLRLVHTMIDPTFTNDQYQPHTLLPGMNTMSDGWEERLLLYLRGENDSYFDYIHPIRDVVGADFVILLAELPNYCGISFQPQQPSASNAFAVVDWRCSSGSYSFANAIAHTMGCQPEPPSVSTTGRAYYIRNPRYRGYNWAYQDPSSRYRTIMSEDCPDTSCPRIPYFSTPEVTYGTELPIGTSRNNNNAGHISSNLQTFANFRSSISSSSCNDEQ